LAAITANRQALTNRIATLRRRARDHDPVTGEVR
jgi:hypothetical protein